MDKAELLRLADKVEAFDLTGPFDIARERERSLNEAIANAVGLPCTLEAGHEAFGNYRKVPVRLPAYTASIDAAASLVPKKPFPGIRPGNWWWSVDSLGCDAHVAYENGDAGIPEFQGQSTTPALALTAAALRAHASEMQGEG